MDVIEKGFLINSAQRDAKGNQVDAEEKRTERVLETTIPISLGMKDESGAVAPVAQSVEQFTGGRMSGLALPQTAHVVGKAIEFASGMRHRCAHCLNFDNPAFLRWKVRMDSGSKDDMAEVDQIRGMLLEREPEVGPDGRTLGDRHVGADGDFDLEHAINECGLCAALEDALGCNELCIMSPDAGCPDYRGNEMVPIQNREDYSRLFIPRDAEAESSGNAAYDTILKVAAGTPVRRAQRIHFPKR